MDNLWSAPQTNGVSLPDAQIIEVEINGDGHVDPKTGAIEIPTGDGGVVVDFAPEQDEGKDTKFDANLAIGMDDLELAKIAEDLLTGIAADDDSRSEWLATRERGIDLLGFKLEEPRGDVGSSSAPLEGMAVVRHPVLAEAVLRGQATACGELLPAAGPVKVEINGEAGAMEMEAGEALETDLNDYLTNVATEYYPDTRRALFWSTFGGSHFKKGYHCPIRLRPAIESIDAKDLIVSAAATDLANAQRITHVISMRQSLMKRMQVADVYRDVPLGQPTSQPDRVTEKQAQVEGISLRRDRPEDQPYTVYECYCELDLDEYAPKQFKGKAIALPYRVTIEKDTRVILEIRRDWREDDERCLRKRCIVKYPYVEGMGFYGIGLLHILGNADSALTAAWRLMLDNGMFANFPGGVVDKAASRQLTNEFRIPPGGMVQLDFGGRNASQVYGQLPYRDLGPVFVQFISNMQETVQRFAGSADMAVGEGRQDAPVGTTLAMIEQATKIISEVHKGLHTAQSEEFQLLKELFKEDPAALWRHCKKSEVLKALIANSSIGPIAQNEDALEQRRQDLFVVALNNCNIVPAADPNTPSHTHRVLKLGALKQVQAGNPNMDGDAVDKMIVRGLGFDPEPLFKQAQAQAAPPPDPRMIAAQAQQVSSQAKMADSQTRAKTAQIDQQIEQDKLGSQERIAALQVQREAVIHAHDTDLEQRRIDSDNMNQHLDRQADLQKHQMTVGAGLQDTAVDSAHQHLDRAADLQKHSGGIVADLHNSQMDRQHKSDMAASKPNGQANVERKP